MATLLAANWKMNPLGAEDATHLARATLQAAQPKASQVEVVIFPPFPWLRDVKAIVRGTVVGVGTQNCYWTQAGAFTGGVSAGMLAGWCCTSPSGRSGAATAPGPARCRPPWS